MNKSNSKEVKRNKKWSDYEVKLILNYLETVPEIEKPTSQRYYTKLIQATGIDAPWNLIKCKVRHLKDTQRKANDWAKSQDLELLESSERSNIVESKIFKICPHYHQLNDIFGKCTEEQEIDDTEDPLTMEESMSIKSEILSEDESQDSTAEFSPQKSTELKSQSPTTIIKNKTKPTTARVNKCVPKSSIAYLAAFQTERTAMFKLKYELEKEKHEKELMMNERKLKLMEDKQKADIRLKERELELKALEIERNERLKMLEIEKDERVRKYEIEMKYKYHNIRS